MDDKTYTAIADATLMHCCDQLEEAFESGMLDDLELLNGILTIQAKSGKIYLLSKHHPTYQLWLASPVLGGLHFSFDEAAQRWVLPDGRALYDLLRGELLREQVTVVL